MRILSYLMLVPILPVYCLYAALAYGPIVIASIILQSIGVWK